MNLPDKYTVENITAGRLKVICEQNYPCEYDNYFPVRKISSHIVVCLGMRWNSNVAKNQQNFCFKYPWLGS